MIVYPLKLAPGHITVTALVGAIILLLAAGFRPAPDEGCEAVAQQLRVPARTAEILRDQQRRLGDAYGAASYRG